MIFSLPISYTRIEYGQDELDDESTGTAEGILRSVLFEVALTLSVDSGGI